MTVKSTNIPEINCHLWAVFSNLRAKTCTITQPTAAILCAREVWFPLKLIAWNYGYTTRTQPKIGRTKLKFSENSPSYALPPCCDVMGLSNLIIVPDWPRWGNISYLVWYTQTEILPLPPLPRRNPAHTKKDDKNPKL